MPKSWISASLAHRLVAVAVESEADASSIIIRAAGAGALAAKAERLIVSKQETGPSLIDPDFWHGDDERRIRVIWSSGQVESADRYGETDYAFDVSFDYDGILALTPAHRRARAIRAISVMGNPDWISARDLFGLVYTRIGPSNAGRIIIDACQTGHIVARATRMTFDLNDTYSPIDGGTVEWDVPSWFWCDFTGFESSSQDWQTGRMSGRGTRGSYRVTITLQGVHFDRDALDLLGLIEPEEPGQTEERKPRSTKYDWLKVSSAIWGTIYRGEFEPKVQADIELAMIKSLTVGDKEPSESTVRPYARVIWLEYKKP